MPDLPSGAPAGADALYALLRCAHFAALMLLWGGSGYALLFCRPALAHVLRHAQRGAWRVAAWVAFLTACLAVPVEAARLAGAWAGAADRDVLAAMAGIHTGAMWLGQIALGLVLLPALFLPALSLPARGAARDAAGAAPVATSASVGFPAWAAARLPVLLLWLLSGAQLAALALGGHAAQRGGWMGDAQRAVQAAHLLAAGAWLGWLAPLLGCLRRLHVEALRAEIGLALRRFSLAGHAAVAVVVLTGALNTAFILGRGLFGPASDYRTLLLAKIAVACGMIALAVANRYVFVPRLRGGQDAALRALRRGTAGEIALGAAALALVSVFASMDPG